MSRVVVIGGTGHIGSYLVPRLIEAGHQVISISRGQREPYLPHPAWASVQQVDLDRDVEEKRGAFGGRVRDLNPDIVIDNLCFTVESAKALVESLRGAVQHLLTTCTIYVHGPSGEVPTTEAQPRRPLTSTPILGEYSRQKALIEAYLLDEARRNGFPVTVIHPAHIVGRGWTPINPAGTFHDNIFSVLAQGQELALPNFGLETIHHVHADDLASIFLGAIDQWGVSVGQAFHAVAPTAVSLRGYAEAVSAWFGKKPKLIYLPWEQWKTLHAEPDWLQAYEAFARSSHSSPEKTRRVLGVSPRYGTFEAIFDSLEWLVANGKIQTA